MELFTRHLTHSENIEGVECTHLGQAHFANTGPVGKTCRECSFWGKRKLNDDGRLEASNPEYEGSASDDLMHLRNAPCNYEIMNKATKYVPHDAGACRLFNQSSNSPVASRERLRKQSGEKND